jgi:hypothetical protein
MKTNAFTHVVLALSLATVSQVRSEDAHDAGTHWTSSRPDGHAPIGVMGDHAHHTGEWMLGYRYMTMDMNGNRDGTSKQREQDVFDEGFMVAPKKMSMDMHMFSAMYAPSDDLTLMGMLPYSEISMDLVTRMGSTFTTESAGFGDLRLAGLYILHRWNQQQLHVNAGISLPTGSVDERDNTPAGPNQKLPYPMQPGSGTFDLLPGITYLGQTEGWSWGSQLSGTFRLGRNSEGYALGNRGDATLWGARTWSRWISTSLRLDGQAWGNIDGKDDDLNPAMVPTADPERRAGERVDLLLGMNLYAREGPVKGHRLAVEFGVPLYQRLDGPQLEMDWLLTAGWQYAW